MTSQASAGGEAGLGLPGLAAKGAGKPPGRGGEVQGKGTLPQEAPSHSLKEATGQGLPGRAGGVGGRSCFRPQSPSPEWEGHHSGVLGPRTRCSCCSDPARCTHSMLHTQSCSQGFAGEGKYFHLFYWLGHLQGAHHVCLYLSHQFTSPQCLLRAWGCHGDELGTPVSTWGCGHHCSVHTCCAHRCTGVPTPMHSFHVHTCAHTHAAANPHGLRGLTAGHEPHKHTSSGVHVAQPDRTQALTTVRYGGCQEAVDASFPSLL